MVATHTRAPSLAALLTLALALALTPTADAALQAQLSETVVEENETVDLTIIGTGSKREASPDLSALENDFEILGTNRSSQFSSINGRVEAWVEYRYQLRPKRTGTLTIGPITVAGETTAPLMLTVRPLDPSVRETVKELVFFEASLDPEPVYVQAQVILTRRFFYARGVQLYTDLPDAPAIEGAVVLPLGETQSTTTRRDGRTYGVVQQQYAIFPQASGTLLIPGESVSASVLLTSNGRTRRRGVQVATQETRVEVLPIPAIYPKDAAWLPARSVELIDQWQPTGGALEVGEPARRRIVVKATGLIGSAIGPVVVDHPETLMRSYPEAPELSDDPKGDNVVGLRIQDYALLPTDPGALTLPAVSVTWWDTINAEVRTTYADAQPLAITGTAVTEPASLPADPEQPVQPAQPEAPDPTTQPEPLRIPWLWLVALALSGAAAWFGYSRVGEWRARFGRARKVRASDALKTACDHGELGLIRREFRSWLAVRYPDLDIDAAQHTFSSIDGNAHVIEALDEHLYGQTRDNHESITGAEVLAAAQRAGLRSPRIKSPPNDPLPQLTIS